MVPAPIDPLRGGAEAYLCKLAERFRAHGHEVGERGDVVLATRPGPCDFYQPHHGLYAESIPPHYESMPWGLRQVRSWNPARRRRFRRLRELEARTIDSAVVLALSPRLLAQLQLHYPQARARLARPGVDLRRFAPRRLPDGARRVLFVARNRRLKGYRTAVRAARMADAELLVAGDGDVAELYARAGALVHPTYYDTASLVVLEALASDIPPITTVRDGNADLAVEGGGAALERPGDPGLLARAITEVLARGPEVGRARAVAERFDETEQLDEVVQCVCSS